MKPAWIYGLVLALGITTSCIIEEPSPNVIEPDVPVDPDDPPVVTDPFGLSEGGGLSAFVLQTGYDPAAQAYEERLSMWLTLFHGQEPATRQILGVTVPDAPSCYLHTAGDYYWTGFAKESQPVADTRAYDDVGESVQVDSFIGSKILTRATAEPDPYFQVQHDIVYLPDPADPAPVRPGTQLVLAAMPPYGDFPGFEPTNGYDLVQNDAWAQPALYVPSLFALTTPSEEAFFAGLTIDPAQDLAFSRMRLSPIPADWPLEIQFLQFMNTDGKLVYSCFFYEAAEFLVPAALFQQGDFPDAGQILVGSLTHLGWHQSSTSGTVRFDFMGLTGKLSTYQLAPAP